MNLADLSETFDIALSLADPEHDDCLLVYVNTAFEEMTGYKDKR